MRWCMQHTFECYPLQRGHHQLSPSHQRLWYVKYSRIQTHEIAVATHHRIGAAHKSYTTTTNRHKNWRHSKLFLCYYCFSIATAASAAATFWCFVFQSMTAYKQNTTQYWYNKTKRRKKKTFNRDINKITEKEHTHIAHRLPERMKWINLVVFFCVFFPFFENSWWKMWESIYRWTCAIGKI